MKTFHQFLLFLSLSVSYSLRAEPFVPLLNTSDKKLGAEVQESNVQESIATPPKNILAPVASSFYFLDLATLEIRNVIPPPPGESYPKGLPKNLQQKLSPEDDYWLQQQIIASATPKQIEYAMNNIEDSVFDYSQVLGSQFNAVDYPLTAAFFDKVRNDVDIANFAAKNVFKQDRPTTWRKMSSDDADFGYSYPSGHTMRAYVWAAILSECFPSLKTEFFNVAERKSWGRVMIGRHFPSDVEAGKIYAFYLIKKFFQNPEFQNEWSVVQAEIREKISSPKRTK